MDYLVNFVLRSGLRIMMTILLSAYSFNMFADLGIYGYDEEWEDPETGVIYSCQSQIVDGIVTSAVAAVRSGKSLKVTNLVIRSSVKFERAGVQEITQIGQRPWSLLDTGYTFSSCEELKSITIPNTITYIGEGCFQNCKNLETVRLSSNINHIPHYCFRWCEKLKSIIIPSIVTYIGKNAFYGCTSLESVELNEGVEKIFPEVFTGCSKLKIINIPSSLKDLGDQVFCGCEQLTNIELPEGLEKFGAKNAFSGCSNLKTIKFPKKVNIPGTGGWDGVLDATFKGCSSLESIELPIGVKSILESTFDGCTTLKKNLKKLILPEGIETLSRCFMDFIGIEEVYFPNSLKTIYGAFIGCTNLKTATIPNSVTFLSQAFLNCKNLVTVNLPNAITELSGFRGCCSLLEVEIPEGVESIDAETFKDCTSLRYIKIPASVMSIGHGAFNGCSSLKTVSLTNGLQKISAYAFYNCTSLESLSIPSSVNSINCYAFENCYNLKDVYVYWEKPFTQFEKNESFSSEESLFRVYDNNYDKDHVYYNAHLHVPNGTESDYKVVSPWSLFWTINKIEKGEKHFILSAKNYTREYGDANPSFDFVESGGTIVSGTPTLTCEATSTSPVGTYPIVISKGSVTNDDVELVNGTLTISKAPLTIKADDCSKKEREENPDFTFTYTGFKNGETESVLSSLPIGSCSATKASGVGTYPIIVSGAEAANYYLTYENGTLTILENEGDAFKDGDWFALASVEGIEITYEVISSVNKTCRVLGDENSHAAVAVSSWVEGELTIPAAANGYTVTEIGDKAFFGCNKLTKVNIPNGVKSIGSDAFWGCKGLTTLDIPSSMTTIGGGAFEDCAGLTSILFPKSITSVGNVIFRGCTELKYVVIEKGVKSIGIGTFYGCNKLSDVYCQSNNVVGGGDSFDNPEKKTLHVPSVSINSYKKAYGWKDFGNIVALKNGDPGYIEGAESDNDEDDESDIIKFADSKTKEICLKYWDTDEDGKLSKTEAAAVLWIGNAFVESEITSFNEFSYFTAVTDIDDAAFRKCKNLQEITLPNSATSIGKQTFAYCQNLTMVVMSNSMSSIGDYAFMGCSSLASIELTDNLTKIGDGAFENCSSLSTISIPASVFYIGGSPFDTCRGLTSINVDSDNMRYCSVDGVLFDKACTKIVQYPIGKKGSEYAIPATVTTIGEGAFISSANLHGITIPEGVMTIELGAFMDCTGLESITIPQCVESLAKYCFYGCSSLKSVTSMIVNPFEIESNVFETGNGIFTTATLYTPMGSASKYQSTGGWKNFKKFMPIGDVNGDKAINDSDVKEETNFIMGNPSKTFVKAAADMNGDGVINVADIVLMNAINLKK